MELELLKKQYAFTNSTADEVLYGGAAGGGKTYAQVIDAFLFALKYPGSRQIVFRKTLPELRRSVIMKCREIYPARVCEYKGAINQYVFVNNSVIEFGYLHHEGDVYRYQSAEYDVVRFDELTHFPEQTYLYMLSRVRGTNGYPKQMKSTGNPGNIGHMWVKKRFVDPGSGAFEREGRSFEFIRAGIDDNSFLVSLDDGYKKRLEQLPEKQRKILLDGDWDVLDGQFFSEFSEAVHVVKPFHVPGHWLRFRSMDYGLDMCVCLWWALDEHGSAYVYREFAKSGLSLSTAAKKVCEHTGEDEKILYTAASPDLWSRRQESGESGEFVMRSNGLTGLSRANNDRVFGWRMVREYLQVGNGGAALHIFECCRNLIFSLPQLVFSSHNAEDASIFPHEYTHAPDALRYGILSIGSKKTSRMEELGRVWGIEERKDGFAVSRDILNY